MKGAVMINLSGLLNNKITAHNIYELYSFPTFSHFHIPQCILSPLIAASCITSAS